MVGASLWRIRLMIWMRLLFQIQHRHRRCGNFHQRYRNLLIFHNKPYRQYRFYMLSNPNQLIVLWHIHPHPSRIPTLTLHCHRNSIEMRRIPQNWFPWCSLRTSRILMFRSLLVLFGCRLPLLVGLNYRLRNFDQVPL